MSAGQDDKASVAHTAQSRLLPQVEAGDDARLAAASPLDLSRDHRSRAEEGQPADSPQEALKQKQQRREQNSLLVRKTLVLFCCFLSGWADTVAVIHFLTFAAMMTGKLIFIGIKMAPEDLQLVAGATQPAWFYFTVICSSILGSFFSSWVLNPPKEAVRAGGSTLEPSTATRTPAESMRSGICGIFLVWKKGDSVSIFC